MIIISDTGPLISLALIDKLHLLDVFYDKIAIPTAVWKEAKKYIDILELLSLQEFAGRVIRLKTEHLPDFNLGQGETEAILLFDETDADTLLIDDKEARDVAEKRQIPCIGTLGILIAAKHAGYIDVLRPLFLKLLASNRYYAISLLNDILVSENEPVI
ncbi:MAG: DUF3368 domain-containing protein [Spirochaetaceae bacterium]|nr:DUF3368 domain-containing protein [Spirochaetaceae bacterium]